MPDKGENNKEINIAAVRIELIKNTVEKKDPMLSVISVDSLKDLDSSQTK